MTIRTPPFEDLSDEAVQEEYEQGRYPEVVTALSDPVLVRLLRYWSWEFEEAWVPTIPPETTSSTIAKGIGIASDVVCDSALLVADAIEFSAVGPVAVSIAGGVQSAIAIGSVAGSSLFSWSWGKTMGVSTTASTDAAVVVSPGAVVAGVEPRKSPWELFKDVVKRDGPQIECKEVVDQPNEKVLSVENKDEKKQEKSPEEKGDHCAD